jgi:hypothetical protein
MAFDQVRPRFHYRQLIALLMLRVQSARVVLNTGAARSDHNAASCLSLALFSRQ